MYGCYLTHTNSSFCQILVTHARKNSRLFNLHTYHTIIYNFQKLVNANYIFPLNILNSNHLSVMRVLLDTNIIVKVIASLSQVKDQRTKKHRIQVLTPTKNEAPFSGLQELADTGKSKVAV